MQLADRFEELAQRCFGQVTDAKPQSATVRDLILCSAISVDKMLLLREHTQSDSVAGQNAEESIKQAAEALARITDGTPAAMTVQEAELRIKRIQISATR